MAAIKTEEGGPSTRERILKASLDLVGREGIPALTTRRVAAEAGVNLGLLHYYFASKEALVLETIGSFVAGLRDLVAGVDADKGTSDPGETLLRIFTAVLEQAWRQPGLLFGLAGQLVEMMTSLVNRKSGGPEEAEGGPLSQPAFLGSMRDTLGFLVARIKALLRERLGDDEALVSRRSIQLFASLLHPLLFTPFPGEVFGCRLDSEASRLEYIKAVLADALRPSS